jgi:acyl-CoA thioesterase-2
VTEPLHDFLSGVKPTEQPGVYVGVAAQDWGRGMFGGMAVGQAVTAVTRDLPAGRRLHSMHLYYVRPSNGGVPIRYEVETVRDGRAFSARRFRASQEDKTTLEGICSFTSDTEGYEYDQPHTSPLPARDGEVGGGPGGLESIQLGPSERTADGVYESTDRKWFRWPGEIGDDVHLHTAFMGFASDWTYIGARPRRLYWNDGDEYGIASLDHSVWFHRPARIDAWHLSDMHALVNFGGRSQIRMTIRDEQGRVVCSAAQELLVKVLPE